ncbi:MAG: hypothetical protein PWQ77_1709 [Kosmotogales bacterium]|nr:hypothetical protein [Kosmotogales bacterium]
MRKFLIIIAFILICSYFFASDLYDPIKRTIEITGNFGEYRSISKNLAVPEHFNLGIGISTGGITGVNVYSPGKGYVESISVNDSLYGHTVTIVLPNQKNVITNEMGIKVMFAHIESAGSSESSDTRKLDKIFDMLLSGSPTRYKKMIFNPNEIEVFDGQIVAQSGDSGNVPPYLHIEIMDNDESVYINPDIYYDFGDPETSIIVDKIKIGSSVYDLNPGERPNLEIKSGQNIDLHAAVKLRYNISPKKIQLFLENNLTYEIDFEVIDEEDSFDPGEVYYDSTNSDYWFALNSNDLCSVITVNDWDNVDTGFSHEAKVIVTDNWGRTASRSFILDYK